MWECPVAASLKGEDLDPVPRAVDHDDPRATLCLLVHHHVLGLIHLPLRLPGLGQDPADPPPRLAVQQGAGAGVAAGHDHAAIFEDGHAGRSKAPPTRGGKLQAPVQGTTLIDAHRAGATLADVEALPTPTDTTEVLEGAPWTGLGAQGLNAPRGRMKDLQGMAPHPTRGHHHLELIVTAAHRHAYRTAQDPAGVPVASSSIAHVDKGATKQREGPHPTAGTVGHPDPVVLVHRKAAGRGASRTLIAELKATLKPLAVHVKGGDPGGLGAASDVDDASGQGKGAVHGSILGSIEGDEDDLGRSTEPEGETQGPDSPAHDQGGRAEGDPQAWVWRPQPAQPREVDLPAVAVAGEDDSAAGSREVRTSRGVVAQEHLDVLGVQPCASPHGVHDLPLLKILKAGDGQDRLTHWNPYPLVAQHTCTRLPQSLGELPLTPILVVVVAEDDVGAEGGAVGAELPDDRKGLIHHVGTEVSGDRNQVRAALLQEGQDRGQIPTGQVGARVDIGNLGDGQPPKALRQAREGDPLLPGMEPRENGPAVKESPPQKPKEPLYGPEEGQPTGSKPTGGDSHAQD